jgi:hypothetical protein
MKPVPATLLTIAQQSRVLGKASGHLFPLQVFNEW